jgi:hypothetical protein
MPVSSRSLILLGVVLLGTSAFNATGVAARPVAGDRAQNLPGKPVQRAPIVTAPIVVGPAPRSVPGFGLSCLTKQVRVCPPCGPNGCPYSYSCHFETRCVRYRR